jgi:hypothetical protein
MTERITPRQFHEDLIDPRGRGASFWFQQMDAPRHSATCTVSDNPRRTR